MLKTYATMSQRVRPRKAAERGVTAAAAVVREKWGALQHLYNQLQSLPENPAKGEGTGNDEGPSAALEAAYAAASADQADQPSESGACTGHVHSNTQAECRPHLSSWPAYACHAHSLHFPEYLHRIFSPLMSSCPEYLDSMGGRGQSQTEWYPRKQDQKVTRRGRGCVRSS